MKKGFLIFLFIIAAGFIFSCSAISENNALNLIFNTDEQLSGNTSDLILQKINELNTALNLTPEQQQKAAVIGTESAKRLNIYKVSSIEEKKKLIILKRNHRDQSEITAQLLVVKDLNKKIDITGEKNIQNFKEILTPEQQVIFEKFSADLKQLSESAKSGDRKLRDVKTRYDALKDLGN